MQVFIFLGIITLVLAGQHYYLWARLVRDTQLDNPSRAILTAAIVLLCLAIPAIFVVNRLYAPSPSVRAINFIAYGWMGVSFLLFTLLLTFDLGRGMVGVGRRIAQRERPADPDKRLTLSRLLAGVAALVSIGGAGVGAANALGQVPIQRVRVPLSRLPKALDGLTIVQISDLHVGPTISRDFVDGVVRQVNGLNADVVAITGDLVDGSVPELRSAVSALANIKSRFGVFFVTGNHEYYSGVHSWLRELPKYGIRVLRNERVAIGTDAASFDLAGIDDYSSAKMAAGHGPDLDAALRGRDPSRELVLLAHQPRAIHQAVKGGVGLQLSGHTHGGQIFPWTYLVLLQQPFIAGLHRVRDTQLYVSRGTGYWGPPMRLGAPAEITCIELAAVETSLPELGPVKA